MSTPIDIALKTTLAALMASEMSISNGYRYDVGSIDEWVIADSEFPSHKLKIGLELDHDMPDGNNREMYQEGYISIVSQWQNTDTVDSINAMNEAEKMAEDIKRLIGGITTLGESSEIFYITHEKKWSNDKTYPIGINTLLMYRYWQLIGEPETAG